MKVPMTPRTANVLIGIILISGLHISLASSIPGLLAALAVYTCSRRQMFCSDWMAAVLKGEAPLRGRWLPNSWHFPDDFSFVFVQWPHHS